jgi:hypothetical protein
MPKSIKSYHISLKYGIINTTTVVKTHIESMAILIPLPGNISELYIKVIGPKEKLYDK